MDKLFKEILKNIKKYETIIIHRHYRPDGDAIGSQLGLKDSLVQSFPDKEIYAVGDESDRFKFLGHMDTIDDQKYEEALVIILDSGTTNMISDMRYKTGAFLIKIDHHISDENYGDINCVDTAEISCASLVFRLIDNAKLELSVEGAKALFTGMVTDSGRFRYDGVNESTFLIASKLTSYGFDSEDIYSNLYVDELAKVRLRAKLALKFKTTPHKVAYLKNTKEDVKSYNSDVFSISRGMIGVMSGIKGIDIWANFTEDTDGVIAEIRSSKYDINKVAVKYGGGGHKKASGATLKDFNEADEMLKDLDKILEEKNDN
ncbi:MAG: bifunctional oligoribonuclease/PAP phosphatase NrnA [Bacilli bacterium]